jgi:hypothetical protein
MDEQGKTAIVGTIGTVTTLSLTQINAALGCVAGVLTIVYLALGIRKRWLNRNTKDEG